MIVWDYPGYGRSDGPLAVKEEELFAAAASVYDFFAQQGGQPLIVWGQSLGSTAAAGPLHQASCRALVMESGLSSARNYAETSVPWLPSRPAGLRQKFVRIGAEAYPCEVPDSHRPRQ